MPLPVIVDRKKTSDGPGPHKSQIRDPLHLFKLFPG